MRTFNSLLEEETVIKRFLVLTRTRLVISLIAATGLASVQPSYAAISLLAQPHSSQRSNNQSSAKAMLDQGLKLEESGNLKDAAASFTQALKILEVNTKSNQQEIIAALVYLANVMIKQAKYEEAEPLISRALITSEKLYGPNHYYTGRILHQQGLAMHFQGRYSAAVNLYQRALGAFVIQGDTLDMAMTLNNQALILGPINSRYAEAEHLLERALKIREKILGSHAPEVAQTVSSMGELLDHQGKYVEAEQHLRRALEIREMAFGINSTEAGYSLNNLAEILRKQGRYNEAESLNRRGLNILKKNIGQHHPYLARAMNNLAQVMTRQGRYLEAEPLLRSALVIHEKFLGPNHLAVAQSLSYLADILASQGRYSAAEPLYRRAVAIKKKSLGPDHLSYAEGLQKLAVTLWDQGRHSQAEPLFWQCLAILEKTRELDNPFATYVLGNLALLLNSHQNHEAAISALARSLTIESNWLLRELPLLPNQARFDQLRAMAPFWQIAFNWADQNPSAAYLALETRLNRQGLLPSIEYLQGLILNSPDIDRGKVEQLQALTQQLSSVSIPPDRQAVMREQRDKLQAEVYRRIPELQIPLLTTAEVAKALPADGVLVEFQRYQPYDERKSGEKSWGAAQYIALVLKPNGIVSAVPLGAAAEIDAKVHQGLLASAQQLSDTEQIWAQLSAQVIKPLLPKLSGSNQWFLSPDGELNRVPFAALPAPQQPGTPLAQAVQLRVLTTGRELVRLRQPAQAGSKAMVLANPNYDRPGTKPPAAATSEAVSVAGQRRSAELSSATWSPLPASKREGLQVARLLGTGLISEAAANTKALQGLQGPQVLHIATHGFFVADQESKPTEAMQSIQEGSLLLRSLRQEDPQLRSGLVLAGANQPDLDPNDDGYLTAAEAVNLNLKGTELVVLSACSTGQGDVRTGEGVYGLQRSLTVAGARSTLLSLWKVDDAATAEFMGRYYQRLKAGEGRSDALAAVQEEFRSGKVQSANGVNWKEPYYWAAWQLVGDWRPIPGL